MFVEGEIKSYITARGFGFISIQGEAKDLFFHIHDFPNAHIAPKIGEKLRFSIVEDHGKLKADQIVRLNLKEEIKESNYDVKKNLSNQQASPRFREKRSRISYLFTVIGLLLILVLSVVVYNKYQAYRQTQLLKAQQFMHEQAQIVKQQRQALGNLPDQVLSKEGKAHLENRSNQSVAVKGSPITEKEYPQVSVSAFKCDGRTHCSQMRSYDEALFFLRNCPGTQMDGNHDGEPCERQFRR